MRIIEETKPKFAIAENVKALTSKKFTEEFKTVLESLETAGYTNYWKVLNAKDYGIPQNRERVFIVSIRKDIDKGFEFPQPVPLELRLKDMLEDEVDEKYYLSDEAVEKLTSSNFNQERTRIQKSDICGTLLARDYKDPKCAAIDKSTNNTRTIDIANCITAREDRGISTRKAEGTAILVKEAVKEGYSEAYPGDSVNVSFPNSKTRRGRVGRDGIANTLTCADEQAVIETPSLIKRGNTTPSGKSQCNGVYDENGLHPALCAGTHGNCNSSVLVRSNPSEVKRLGNIYGFTGGNYAGNVYDPDGSSPALRTMCGGNQQPIIKVKKDEDNM